MWQSKLNVVSKVLAWVSGNILLLWTEMEVRDGWEDLVDKSKNFKY